MEPKFQTSFIPKKPMVEERATSGGVSFGIFTIIGIFVLFSVVLATVGLYFYKGILNKNITQMRNDLEKAKGRFEPAKISELQVLDRRLRASSEILSKHITVAPVFKVLSEITMKTVRYTQFNYTFGGDEKDPKVIIDMDGLAVGYRSIALQSDLFTEKAKNFIDPVFSNLTLDDKGNVLFNLKFSVDPAFVNYKTVLGAES